MKILIMGLPGSGKTTLASKLTQILNARWIHADKVRKKFNDWDFSRQGVLRQAKRMGDLADSFQEKIIIESTQKNLDKFSENIADISYSKDYEKEF